MEPFHTGYRHHLKLGVLKIDAHAYFPLLHADKGCKVTIQPVALDRNEKTVVEALNDLAARADPCVQGRELYLIRNLARGSGRVVLRRLHLLPGLHRPADRGRRHAARHLS